MKLRNYLLISAAASTALLIGCGGDEKAEAQKVEAEAKQDFQKTADSIDKMAAEAAQGVKTAAEEVEKKVTDLKDQADQTTTQVKETAAVVQAAPEEAKKQAYASMSLFQKQLTEQLGEQAANELEGAMKSLKTQADDMLVNSAVDSLSSALASGNNPGALNSLTSLTDLASQGKINPITLTDVASISSASILSNSFSSGEQPTLIESAIDAFTNSRLLTGSKDLLSAVTGGGMSASQTQTANQLLDSLKPLLGTWGENLDQVREAGSKVNDATNAIKSMF